MTRRTVLGAMRPMLRAAASACATLRATLAARRETRTPETCMAAADRAMVEERWRTAARWLERARRLAPTSVRVRMDLAFARQQLGQHERAFLQYEETVRLDPASGEAHFHGARACLAAGRPLLEAEGWLARALVLDPSLALDTEEDELLAPLRERPRVRALLHRAWDSLGPATRR